MNPFYANASCTIFHADADAVLPLIRPDVVITDPPYGIEMGVGKDMRARSHGLAKRQYDIYEDSYENFVNLIVPRLNRCIDAAKRAAVFTGPHIQEQRKMDAIGGIYCPAGLGRHSWGFKTFLPVLFYGTAPDLNKGARPNVIQSTTSAEDVDHPCPKPLDWMLWLVDLCSRPGDLVFDPFCGSGTCAVACQRLGRRFVGAEISEAYCKVAAERLAGELFAGPSSRGDGQLLLSAGDCGQSGTQPRRRRRR